MFKKLILIIKLIIIVITSFVLLKLWSKKDFLLNLILSNSSTKAILILKPIYTAGIIVFLLIIFVGVIYILFKGGNNMLNKNIIKDKDKNQIKLIKRERVESIPYMYNYYFKNCGKTLSEFKSLKEILEVIYNTKFYGINYGKDTKTFVASGIPYDNLKPKVISLFPDDELYKNFINMLIVGGTGSGKTFTEQIILASLLMKYQNSKLYFCDFKNYDFKYLEDCHRYYGYKKVLDGIREVYNIFKERIASNETDFDPIILCIDEYATFLSSLEKDEEKEVKKNIADILFMGRSYKIITIISVQRADSTYFNNGSRDQFRNILALGNLSKEAKAMLFNDFKDEIDIVNGRGEGYLYRDGNNLLEKVKVSQLLDNEQELIKEVLKNRLK